MRDPRAASLRFTLVASAVVLAMLAQLFIRDGGLHWAIAPLVVAVACLVLDSIRGRAGRDKPELSTRRQLSFDFRPQPAKWGFKLWNIEFNRSDIGWAFVIAACLLMSLSLQNFGQERVESLSLAWYCFGSAVILLLVGIAVVDGRLTAVISRIRARGGFRIDLGAFAPWLILGVILVVAAGARLYNLNDVPAGLWFDEADNLSHAQRYAQEPGRIPVYEPSTNLPTLFLLPIAALIDVAGVSVTTGRLVAVAFGLLGIVATFLLARRIFGASAGLIAAFLVACMRWDIIWSRIGMHGITGVLFAALCGWLTLRALETRRYSDFALAGVSLGLGMWFYASFRLFPLVLGFMLIHHLVVSRPKLRRFALCVLLMILTSLFVAAPLVQYAADNREEFFSRQENTSLFNITPREEWAAQINESLIEHILMFNRKGDPNPRHNLPDAPMLDFITGALFVVGFFFALTRWRNTGIFILPLWALLMTLPGVLTVPWESPQSLRSILVIPAVAALAAYPLDRLWRVSHIAAPWKRIRRFTLPALAGALALILYINLDFYFDDQAKDPRVYAEFSTADVLMAESHAEMQRLGYSIWTSRQFKFGLTGELLGNRPKVEVIRPPDTLPMDFAQVWHGAAIYFESRERGFWELTRAYYPDGQFDAVTAPNGGPPLFYTAFVSREAIAKRQGLGAEYTFWNEPIKGERQDLRESTWHAGDGPDQYPYNLNISGALKMDAAGEYEFQLDGNLDAYVELDGLRILSPEKRRSKVEPAVGLHTLSIKGSVSEPGRYVRLLWKTPGGELEPIPFSHLYRDSVRPLGAVGRFFASGNDESDLYDSLEIAPTMDVFRYFPVIDEPHTVVWDGMLEIEQLGNYKFAVEKVSGPLKFYFDNDLMAQDPPSDDVGREGEVLVGTGSYPIRIEYSAEDRGRSTMFKILWHPPGGDLVPIPVEAITPARERTLNVIE